MKHVVVIQRIHMSHSSNIFDPFISGNIHCWVHTTTTTTTEPNLQAILLYVFEDGTQLGVGLQGFHLVLHRRVAVGELRVVVLRNGLESVC